MKNPITTTDADRIARMDESCLILGIKPRTLRHWVAKGLFPKPVAIGPRARGYQLSTLSSHIAQRQQEVTA